MCRRNGNLSPATWVLCREVACQSARAGVYFAVKSGMDQSAKNSARPQQHSKPLLYVVDDEPLLLELASALLEPSGYTVKTFRDPEAALRSFASANPRPAVVLTDYAMHTMTGLELIRECRRINPGQKIIMLSGTVDESVYRGSTAKPDRFLAKPYQAKELLGMLESVLGS